MRIPRFMIFDIDSCTVDKRTFIDSHFWITLKILRSLKALNAERGEFMPEYVMAMSIILTHTIKQSNLLKNSEKYTESPNPIIFKIISTVKINVKTKFA